MSGVSKTRLVLSSCFIPASLGSEAAPFRSFALSAGLAEYAPQIMLCMEGAQKGIGSQIATKLAGDTVLSEIYRCLSEDSGSSRDLSEQLVRNAFREANSEVYRYAHTMAAGGQIATKAILSVFDGQKLTVGQVGPYESLLFRDGSLMRFFEHSGKGRSHGSAILDRFVGANAKVLVDLAALNVEPDDLLVLSTASYSDHFFYGVEQMLAKKSENLATLATEVGKILLGTEESASSQSRDFESHRIFVARVVEV